MANQIVTPSNRITFSDSYDQMTLALEHAATLVRVLTTPTVQEELDDKTWESLGFILDQKIADARDLAILVNKSHGNDLTTQK